MRIRRFLRKPLALTGALTLGYLGTRGFFNTLPGADERFFEWTGPVQRATVRGADLTLPVKYYRTDAFLGIFSADLDAVQATLPGPGLFPVRLGQNRANLVIAAFNYHLYSFDHQHMGDPYGEVAIGTFCTYREEAPALLPLLLESRYPDCGIFVFHLPVTNLAARDGGRQVWGAPKFVADMDFVRLPSTQRVTLSEEGEHILTLTVRQRGLPIHDGRPLRWYSTLERDLLRTTLPTRAIYQLNLLPGAGNLTLGSHAIAAQLKEFGIGGAPIVTRAYLSHAALLPAPEKIGRVDRPYLGHQGRDIEFARLTTCYDEALAPLDSIRRDEKARA